MNIVKSKNKEKRQGFRKWKKVQKKSPTLLDNLYLLFVNTTNITLMKTIHTRTHQKKNINKTYQNTQASF
jgi:hypothetical protein